MRLRTISQELRLATKETASFLENENPESPADPVTRRQANPVTKTNRITAIAAVPTSPPGRMAEKQFPLLPPRAEEID
jgi:hypothetical protein